MKIQGYECPKCAGALGTARVTNWTSLKLTRMMCPKCGTVEPILRREVRGG